MENPIHIATFKAMGANPTPMSFSELYTALAQKTVDGQDNPVVLTFSSKFYEVQKYYSLTGHIFAVAPLVISESFFKSLPKEHQKVVLDAGKRYEASERKATEEQDIKMLDQLKATGMQINSLNDAERALFIKATEPVYAEFEKLITKEEALMRVEPDQLNQLLRPIFDPNEKAKALKAGNLVSKGLNAGPGAASGNEGSQEQAAGGSKPEEDVIDAEFEAKDEKN